MKPLDNLTKLGWLPDCLVHHLKGSYIDISVTTKLSTNSFLHHNPGTLKVPETTYIRVLINRVLTSHYIIPSYKRGRNVYVQLRNINIVATCKIHSPVPKSGDVSFSLFRFLPLPQVVVAGIVQAPGPDPLEVKTPLYGASTRPATEECRGYCVW